jgi:aromatic ring-opening dioxygenase LigB subunit
VLGAVLPSNAVLVPEVGRARERPAVRTIGAARAIGRQVRELDADGLLILLPPGELDSGTVVTSSSGHLRRGFDRLDAMELLREDRIDSELVRALIEAARPDVFRPAERDDVPAAALATLYFLSTLATLPIALIAVAGDESLRGAEAAAGAIATATDGRRRIAVCAVDELSSKLFRGAPGGYGAAAEGFDRRMVESLRRDGPGAVAAAPAAERNEAGESIVSQHLILDSAIGSSSELFLSYDGPFGVGVLTGAWLSGDRRFSSHDP